MKWSDRIGRRVKLRDLHIALAVAESGSMSKAAEVLSVSYPVVSKTISELEHTLGVKLFDRSISGAEPTHYGRVLLKCGRAVFDEMRQGLENIEFIRQPDSGDLRIASSELMDGRLLPAIIEEFSRVFPRVALHVRHSNVALQQYESLRNHVGRWLRTLPSHQSAQNSPPNEISVPPLSDDVSRPKSGQALLCCTCLRS